MCHNNEKQSSNTKSFGVCISIEISFIYTTGIGFINRFITWFCHKPLGQILDNNNHINLLNNQ